MTMSRAPKRFLKKVPPSGGFPVFKLTLPHAVVHQHLAHLIDAEFELASSHTAALCWQGSIAPRRNKDRSEYTLQGWKLFAEAHNVKAGDQVSFELVSANRLVVQVISPSTSMPASAESPARRPAKLPKIKKSSSPQQTMGSIPVQEGMLDCKSWPSSSTFADDAWRSFPQSPPQQPSSFSEEGSSQIGANQKRELACCTYAAKVASPSLPEEWQSAGNPTRPFRALDSSGPINVPSPSSPCSMSLFMQLDGTDNAMENPTTGFGDAMDALFNDVGKEVECTLKLAECKAEPPLSNLDLHLNNLTSTVQGLQSDIEQYEQRALKAESEAAVLKASLCELRMKLERQSQAALQAGAGLEKAAGKLTALKLIASVDQTFAERLLAIQAEMYNFVDLLNSSIWQLISSND